MLKIADLFEQHQHWEDAQDSLHDATILVNVEHVLFNAVRVLLGKENNNTNPCRHHHKYSAATTMEYE